MLNSQVLLCIPIGLREWTINFIVGWNDMLLVEASQGSPCHFVGSFRAMAIEAFSEVINAVQQYESPKIFAYDTRTQEVLNDSRSMLEQRGDFEKQKEIFRLLDYCAMVCHLINEYENGDVKNPQTVIPFETWRYAFKALELLQKAKNELRLEHAQKNYY